MKAKRSTPRRTHHPIRPPGEVLPTTERGKAIDLRKLAKGQPCFLELAGCSGDHETVVLAHIRRGHTAGMGQKPPDVCAMPMCHDCHAIYDCRDERWRQYGAFELQVAALHGLIRWLAYLWNTGVLKT